MSAITNQLTLAAAKAPRTEEAQLMLKAAEEIEWLREAIRRLADQDATLSVCDGNVTVTMDATLTDAEREAVVEALATVLPGNIAPLYLQPQPTLSAAEREAVEQAADFIDAKSYASADTLRGLLARLK
jgi:hypothetical protein